MTAINAILVVILAWSTPAGVLVDEGHKFGANIVESPLQPFLSSLADEHAREVCNGATPHDNFLDRARRAGRGEISEIVARSWPDRTLREGAAEAWKDWKTSRSHWRTANGRPKAYGAALRQDKRGRWVAVIIASWE